MCGWTDTEKNERHRVDRNGSRWKEVKKWLNGESVGGCDKMGG